MGSHDVTWGELIGELDSDILFFCLHKPRTTESQSQILCTMCLHGLPIEPIPVLIFVSEITDRGIFTDFFNLFILPKVKLAVCFRVACGSDIADNVGSDV